ncbi:PepSY domain-containing protein [Mycobacterium crocinum]|uniref:PepSY domain-containing protein n=1 Tax=Mycolicibacterium crocinum TaxID=388459 RepID=A0ABY3TJG7_9MYCO|nr:PepSY domain-containing protein [Mycolicibacterium crocinum]MCV7215513.1 PepSY domain-containing protein [Mycolicibacterium crocinum]ULN40017.1 PepSY domain-containing protein [Mycolicibacterium crocinum]
MTTTESSTRRADAAVLRRIWRLHFWVGLFAAPVLVVLACSGLVILYSQPLDALLNRHLLVVESGPQTVPLDTQVATAKQHVGAGDTLEAVTPPDGVHASTRVDFSPAGAKGYPQAEADVIQVFVDPYTGAYLGQRDQLSGLVGWANQLHRMFGNDGPHMQLPSLGHVINPSAYPQPTIPVGIGNLWMELTATWILVLLASGIYLWWPRAIEAAKPLLTVRWRQGGRPRWRDVHALTGVVVAVILICYVLSGMTWTRYWGENWRAVTATVTPSAEIDAPSTPAKLGDLDRLGRRIAWAATDDPIYASEPSPGAARLSYADIDRIAKDEHMVPGYAIFPPSDSTQDGATTYGSYTVVNRWPQRVSEQRTLYLNQFTGATITNATAAQDGALSKLTSFGIAMHTGNQMGWLTRISATLACLGVLLSVATGLLMWWTRRPSGRSGLPGPASETTRANTSKKAMIAVTVVAVILGILFPAFGISLLVVLVAEAIISARRPSPGQASLVTSTTTSRSVEPSPE